MKNNVKNRILPLLVCSFLFSNCASDGKEVTVRVAKFKDDKVAAISYTYDDGLKEHYTLVAPEMEKRGFRGTFWVNGISVNPDDEQVKDTSRVSWPQLKEMALRGHEISNHGWSHAKLTKLSREGIIAEIEKNDSIILKEVGIPSQTFCYPYNAKNEEVLELASKGRVGTRTKQRGIGSKSTSENLEEWVNTLLETNDWGVGMIHGITYGYDAFGDSAPILWEHFDKVKALEDSIWVGTFREVAAYTKEYEEFKYDMVQKGNEITVTPQLALDSQLFNEPLTLVVEKEKMSKIEVTQGGKALPTQLSPGKAIFDFDPYGGKINIKVK